MTRRIPSPVRTRAATQRGVVLLFCLIILVVLLAGAVAVVRSMNASMTTSGNLAFRRDLVNQGEQAISKAMQAFQDTGALSTGAESGSSLPNANYSAVELQTNDGGVPLLLLSRPVTASGGTEQMSGPDVNNNTFTSTGSFLAGRDGVRIRYVIDRLCNAAGTFAVLGSGRCVASPVKAAQGGTAGVDRPPTTSPPLYRVSVRVDGPRETQVYLQSTFTKPE